MLLCSSTQQRDNLFILITDFHSRTTIHTFSCQNCYKYELLHARSPWVSNLFMENGHNGVCGMVGGPHVDN